MRLEDKLAKRFENYTCDGQLSFDDYLSQINTFDIKETCMKDGKYDDTLLENNIADILKNYEVIKVPLEYTSFLDITDMLNDKSNLIGEIEHDLISPKNDSQYMEEAMELGAIYTIYFDSFKKWEDKIDEIIKSNGQLLFLQGDAVGLDTPLQLPVIQYGENQITLSQLDKLLYEASIIFEIPVMESYHEEKEEGSYFVDKNYRTYYDTLFLGIGNLQLSTKDAIICDIEKEIEISPLPDIDHDLG